MPMPPRRPPEKEERPISAMNIRRRQASPLTNDECLWKRKQIKTKGGRSACNPRKWRKERTRCGIVPSTPLPALLTPTNIPTPKRLASIVVVLLTRTVLRHSGVRTALFFPPLLLHPSFLPPLPLPSAPTITRHVLVVLRSRFTTTIGTARLLVPLQRIGRTALWRTPKRIDSTSLPSFRTSLNTVLQGVLQRSAAPPFPPPPRVTSPIGVGPPHPDRHQKGHFAALVEPTHGGGKARGLPPWVKSGLTGHTARMTAPQGSRNDGKGRRDVGRVGEGYRRIV